jgi:hypothetical protein
LLEISEIGRRLILLGRHQQPISAVKIVFLADHDLVVAANIEIDASLSCGAWQRISSSSYGEAIVPIFIDRGAPLMAM